MPGRKRERKWIWIGLLPLLAGAGLWTRRLLSRRPVPRRRALAPRPVPLTGRGGAPVREPERRGEAAPPVAASSGVPTLVEDASYAGIEGEPVPEGGGKQRGRAPETGGVPPGAGIAPAVSEHPPRQPGAAATGAGGQPGEHPPRHQGETATPGEEAPLAGHALETQTAENFSMLALLVPFIILAIAILILSLSRLPVQTRAIVPGGDVERGRVALQSWGCGSCHTIPGVVGAGGKVGPNLREVGLHSFIAGRLENTPENLVLWIRRPQQVSPGNAMPDTGVSESMARDMAAYIYSLSNNQGAGAGQP